jgi:hypothetical protein
MMGLRNQAEQQFRIAVEHEGRDRRWAGQTLDWAWRRSAIQEERTILDSEREHKLTSEVSESHSHGSVPARSASSWVGLLYPDARTTSGKNRAFPLFLSPHRQRSFRRL